MKQKVPTTHDLVVLSLLAEQPMHGYQLNSELTRREAQDWAEISKPQVYYSLRKLAVDGYIQVIAENKDSLGPERQTYQITTKGKASLSIALARPQWAEQRPPPPFLTWLALANHTSNDVVKSMIQKRRAFVRTQMEKEQHTLLEISEDAGSMQAVAQLMVGFMIRQFESELIWLEEVENTLISK